MSTPTNDGPATSLETEPCSRCGGSGRYSFTPSAGSVCFKCDGKGRALTKRGMAASKFLQGLRSKAARDLVPGDEIWTDAVPGIARGGWHKIVSIEPCAGPKRDDLLTLNAAGFVYSCAAPEQTFRVRQTKEKAAETIAAALAYQGTLTAAGTERKRRAA